MPCDYRRYHPDWKSIVRQIKGQAGDCCEFCGVPNGEWIVRGPDGQWQVDPKLHGVEAVLVMGFGPKPRRGPTRIVLTVAHLDHDIANNDPCNLRALCQKCHLGWDAKLHAASAARTRLVKRVAAGQLELAS